MEEFLWRTEVFIVVVYILRPKRIDLVQMCSAGWGLSSSNSARLLESRWLLAGDGFSFSEFRSKSIVNSTIVFGASDFFGRVRTKVESKIGVIVQVMITYWAQTKLSNPPPPQKKTLQMD